MRSPVTTVGDAEAGLCTMVPPPAGVPMTVKPVMGVPPLAGLVQLTLADAIPGVATTPVGADGDAKMVTAAEGAEEGPSPIAFVATTVKVYVVPGSNPVTMACVALPEASALTLPGLAKTVE